MRNVNRFVMTAVLFLALLSIAGPGYGQRTGEGRGYLMAGAQGMDIGALNSRLRANGYDTFPGTFATFGGGGYGIMGRFVIGGEGVGVMGGSKSGTIGADLFKTSLNGGYGLFRIGYIVARRGGLIVYPTFGIGGGGLSLEIDRRETVSFDSILQNPRRSARLGSGFLLLDLGVGADNMVVLNRRGNEEGGIVFGLHAGYLFSPYQSGWGDALDGPDAAIQGAYVRLVVGGGGSRSR